jgi:hypothetical protein
LRIIEAEGQHKELLKGARMLSVGGLTTDQIITELWNYCFTETQYWVKEYFINDILKRSILNRLTSGIRQDSVPVIFIPDGTTEPVELKLGFVSFDQRPKVEIQKTPYFEYRILDKPKAIHFMFRSFFDDQVIRNLGEERASQYGLVESGDFKDFLRDMFGQAYNRKVKGIIIDLRQNTGGNSVLGFQFLRYINTEGKRIKEFSYQEKLSKYLMLEYRMTPWQRFKAKYLGAWPEGMGKLTPLKEEGLNQALDNRDSEFYMPPVDPELKFHGKLIMLISNRTFSSAMEFATILSDNDLAVLVGEPTGGKPESFGDVLTGKLPHSGFRLGVSYKIFHRPDSAKKDEISLFPDHEVVTTYDDFKKGTDPVLDHARELLKSEPTE